MPDDPFALALLLDHPSYSVRIAAQQDLIGADLDALQINRLYTDAKSPEARLRLLAVARHHFIADLRSKGPLPNQPGSIGVLYDTISNLADDTQPPRVVILATVPGFPGHVKLRPGDHLLGIDGDLFDHQVSDRHVRSQLQLMRANEVHTFRIDRDGQVRNLELAMAASVDLNKLYDKSPGQPPHLKAPYADQWRQRVEELRTLRPESEPMRVTEWAEAGALEDTGG